MTEDSDWVLGCQYAKKRPNQYCSPLRSKLQKGNIDEYFH